MNIDEIIFRARRAKKPVGWVEGKFYKEDNDHCRIVNEEGEHPVIAGSQEVWTGLYDINGEKIWTGSIVAIPYVDPMGNVHTEEENSVDTTVVRRGRGRFILKKYKNQREPESITEWRKREKGDYIPNWGKETIYKDDTNLRIVGNTWEDNNAD